MLTEVCQKVLEGLFQASLPKFWQFLAGSRTSVFTSCSFWVRVCVNVQIPPFLLEQQSYKIGAHPNDLILTWSSAETLLPNKAIRYWGLGLQQLFHSGHNSAHNLLVCRMAVKFLIRARQPVPLASESCHCWPASLLAHFAQQWHGQPALPWSLASLCPLDKLGCAQGHRDICLSRWAQRLMELSWWEARKRARQSAHLLQSARKENEAGDSPAHSLPSWQTFPSRFRTQLLSLWPSKVIWI